MPRKRSANRAASRGRITAYYSGVARIDGLPDVFLHEVLFDVRQRPAAVVVGFDADGVDALFFNESFNPDGVVVRSGKPFTVPINRKLTGRVVSGIGVPIDGLGPIRGKALPVFRTAPPIRDRDPVTVPLTTGIKVIDTNLPLGRGQRELIIGDRKLGKSTIAIDAVLNQKHADPPVECVIVLIGQKEAKLRELLDVLERRNALLYTTVVAATAGSSFAEQYLAPYVGCAIAEAHRDDGRDALIIYDDLSKHADAYRDIALLLERAPGREAYPGDIFSLHANLLERAGQLSKKNGGGSLTALPIIETQEGDITSFIPTNLISITDGQIYLDRGLFQKGFIPAVDVGLSVSRVGSQAQPPFLKEVVKSLRLALAQHKELQKLSQLETVVSDEAQKRIHRGDLTLELLKQHKQTNITWPEQVVLFSTVEEGYFDTINKEDWSRFESLLLNLIRNRYRKVLTAIRGGSFSANEKQTIRAIVEDFTKEFFTEVP